MNGQIERVSHISVTRRTADGAVTRTNVHIAELMGPRLTDDGTAMSGHMTDPSAGHVDDGTMPGDCFDPDSCCDEREKALIIALRAYLRPEVAPECLLRRLRETLDHCCCEDQ